MVRYSCAVFGIVTLHPELGNNRETEPYHAD